MCKIEEKVLLSHCTDSPITYLQKQQTGFINFQKCSFVELKFLWWKMENKLFCHLLVYLLLSSFDIV